MIYYTEEEIADMLEEAAIQDEIIYDKQNVITV